MPPAPRPSAAPKPSVLPLALATPNPSPTPTPSLAQTVSSPSPAPEASPPSNNTHQPGAAQLGEVPDAPDLTLSGSGPGRLTSVEDEIEDLDGFVLVAPARSHLQENARLDPPPKDGTARNVTGGSPANVLPNISNAPTWMKKKRILEYLRDTPKLGCLSDVIRHWYELEELLGFPDAVSFREHLIPSNSPFMISRPRKDSLEMNAHRSSVYFTSMHITTGKTTKSKSIPLDVR